MCQMAGWLAYLWVYSGHYSFGIISYYDCLVYMGRAAAWQENLFQIWQWSGLSYSFEYDISFRQGNGAAKEHYIEVHEIKQCSTVSTYKWNFQLYLWCLISFCPGEVSQPGTRSRRRAMRNPRPPLEGLQSGVTSLLVGSLAANTRLAYTTACRKIRGIQKNLFYSISMANYAIKFGFVFGLLLWIWIGSFHNSIVYIWYFIYT